MKSGRTLAGALAMGAPTQEAIFGSLAAATPLATFNVFNRGIPQSIAAKTAAQKIDQALSDVSPETEEGTAAAGYALSQDPDTELSRFLPEDSSAYQIADALNEQSSAPGTLPSLAFRKLADFIKSKGQNQAQPAPDVREDTGAGFSGAGTGQEGAGQEGAFDYGAGTGQSGAFDSDGNFGVTGQSGGTVTVDFGYDPNTDGPGIPAESIYGPAESLFDDEEGGQSASPGEGDGQADGGTVLCTVLYSIGIMPERIYQADVCYASTLNRNVVHGYRAWAQPLARGMERSGMLLAVMAPMVMLWANHMAYHGSGGAVGRKNVFGNICENVGMPICRFIGKFVR